MVCTGRKIAGTISLIAIIYVLPLFKVIPFPRYACGVMEVKRVEWIGCLSLLSLSLLFCTAYIGR